MDSTNEQSSVIYKTVASATLRTDTPQHIFSMRTQKEEKRHKGKYKSQIGNIIGDVF